MERLSSKRVSRLLLIACFSAYLITSTVKMCVPTVISSMVKEGFLTKSESGLLSGIFYLVYGIGQLVFGKYFNSHAPFVGIKIALLGSSLCCVLMAMTDNFYLLLLIWSLCALANAGFFPALMKITAAELRVEDSRWSSKYLYTAYQFGTLFCLSAGVVFINYIGWVELYYFGAVIALICFIFWMIAERITKRCEKEEHIEDQNEQPVTNAAKMPLTSYIGTGLFCLFFAVFFNNMLNGIKSWSTTILMETYGTSPAFSTLLNFGIVILNIIFLLSMEGLPLKNKVRTVMILQCILLPVALLMNFAGLFNEYIYALLLGIFTSLAAYSNGTIVMQTPQYFRSYNDVSRISGVFNMFSSFALLVGNYAYGALADSFGWQIITVLCACFIVINIVLTAIASPKFQKFTEKQHGE